METTMTERPHFARTAAVVECVLVLLLTMALSYTVTSRLSQEHPLWLNLTAHLVFALAPIGWLLATRRSPRQFAISLSHRHRDWHFAMATYLPVALGASTLAFVDYRAWTGALVLCAIQLFVFFAVVERLHGEPDTASGYAMLLISGVVLAGYGLWSGRFPGAPVALLAFATYLAVGFGEEILYRGYIQSRLNQAFGRPYRIQGINWGWGLVIAALLFGLTHTGLLRLALWPLVGGDLTFTWPWGLWTFCGGLVFGIVRERTGSIVAPAMLHGLPQAVAVALMGG